MTRAVAVTFVAFIAAVFVLLALPGSSRAQDAEGSFVGGPPPPGVSLVVYSGGPVEGLTAAAPAATSFWVAISGQFIGYLAGSPAFVNQAFLDHFPNGIPPGQPMVVLTPLDGAGPPPPSTPTPTPTPTATPQPSVDERVAPVATPFLAWVIDADLTGFHTAEGEPVVPAWTDCSTDASHLGWGLFDGASVSVIGLGTGVCSDWSLVAANDEEFFLPQPHLALSPPLPSVPSTPIPVVETCIDGDFEGWSGETLFELCNGQVWIQTSFGWWYHYAYRPEVTITETGGIYSLSLDGYDEAVTVERVYEFTRTCIDGTFEGFEWGAVFVLCNGQVWEQASATYRYRYAYRPDVIIYRPPGGGYRMKVEGIDDSIAVVRIQ